MKRDLPDFATIPPICDAEVEARRELAKNLSSEAFPWQFYAGIAEGVEQITRFFPEAKENIPYKATARLVIVVAAKLALEAIQLEEDIEGFPEEI